TDNAIALTNDADQLPHLEPSPKQLDCARSGKAQTVSVDLAVLVKDSAARIDTDSRFEFSAFVAVDPAELEAILVELELLAEDALLLIDDGKGKPRQPVIHRIDTAILDELGDVIRVDLGADAAKLEMRPGAKVFANQAYDPVPMSA